jgi:hypothetical protein
MVQKSRGRLAVVGGLMVYSAGLGFFVPYFWVPGMVLVLAGGYLLVWAPAGKGCWCRNCKKFGL